MPKLSATTEVTSAASTDDLYIVSSGNSRRIEAGNLFSSMTRFSSAPATAKGVAGDKIGMLAFDTNYIYICTATYTSGTANIWRRASITEW
jgi:hypothetical protein